MAGDAFKACLRAREDGVFCSMWQALQVLPGTPPPLAPRAAGG
jgi:hypothetical protein